ncbi:pilus assembly protein [Massilia sp. H-1]|nr:pilus assembly protein [Massilia sp. H-1]
MRAHCLPQQRWPGSALLADPDPADTRFVEYGRFTAAIMPVGRAMLPARLPRYIIEQLPFVRAGESAGQQQALFFRITAIGFGANPVHCVVLQSYYLKWRRLGRTHEARMDPVPAAPVRLRAGRAAACRATCAAGRAARGRGLAWRCGPALAAPMSCAPASICPVRAAICCATH